MALKPLVLAFYIHEIYLFGYGNCLRYEHTVFQRNIGSSSTSEITSSPLSSAKVTKLAECWRLCTGQSNCASLLYDDRTSNCSLLGNIIDVRNVNQDLEYFVVKSSAQYMDIIQHARGLCAANTSGFLYDPTIPVCYKMDTTPRSKNNAVAFCGQFNGHLLKIDSPTKQTFVETLNLLNTGSIAKYRVDGKYSGGEWKFSDGRRITQFYWYPGEPHSESTHTSIGLRYTHFGKWDDIKEGAQHGCICERDVVFD